MLRQLAKDQQSLADSIDLLTKQQLFREQDKLGARNELNTFEDVLREIFGRPSRRVKVKEFQQLIKEHSSSFRPHELKKASEITAGKDDESELSVDDLQVLLSTPTGSPTGAASTMAFPTAAASPTTGVPAGSTAVGVKTVQEIYEEFKNIKATGGKPQSGTKPFNQQVAEDLLAELDTKERKTEFLGLLKSSDIKAKYKQEALKQSGFKFSTP